MKYLFLITISILSISAHAQDGDGRQYSLFKSKTYVKNPFDLRDPFKRKITKKKAAIKEPGTMTGVYTNVSKTLDNKIIENMRVVGVVLGSQRRAIVKFTDEIADGEMTPYYVKEGMRIGENGAEVKAILPGGIVLVEKIRNVYDQDEYLETVVPVSND